MKKHMKILLPYFTKMPFWRSCVETHFIMVLYTIFHNKTTVLQAILKHYMVLCQQIGTGVSACPYDNISDGFYVSRDEKEYNDYFGNALGDEYEKAKKKIKKEFINETNDSFVIYFDKNGNKLLTDNISEAYSSIRYTKGENGEISAIAINVNNE